jgi:hypothetical protein
METNKLEFRDRKIFISSDIEGGNALNFKKYPGNIYSFVPRRDPGEGYSGQAYLFKVLVKNLQKDPTNVTITAIADYDEIWKGWQSSLNPVIWMFSPDQLRRAERLSQDRIRATPQSMSINVTLQSYEKIILTNMFTPSYSELVQEIRELTNIYPTFLKLNEIGCSPMGNIIYSIEVNPSDNVGNLNKILIGGSPQPNEFGDFGAISILKEFLEQGAEFWDEFSERFSLEFILFQNPDGMISGTNMVNANGENLFFSYFDGEKTMPEENQLIWNHIKRNPPKLYLEMHSFFQDYKLIQPYLYPIELLPEKKQQKMYLKIANSLIKYSNGNCQKIQKEQLYFRDTLCYQLMKTFHALSYQYKLHSGMSIEENQNTAWKIFLTILRNLKKNR